MPEKKEKTVHLHIEGDFTLRDGKIFVSKYRLASCQLHYGQICSKL